MAKILIVDDDPSQRQVLRLALSIRGHEIYEAANGKEAVQFIHNTPPDVVILDWQMPGMDGPQVCRVIRASNEAAVRGVPIVAVSAMDCREEAIASGASDFLRKPFGVEDLISRIGAALSREHSRGTE